MVKVTPKSFFLGDMTFAVEVAAAAPLLPGVRSWLRHIGGEEAVACLDHMQGSDLEQLIELLARRCYKSFAVGLNPNVTKIRTDSAEYHANIAKQMHGSVMAHGHCTYAFEDVSRVFTHEVVRNHTGNDMSQESLRYVRLDDIRFWTPPILADEKEKRIVPPKYDSHKGHPNDWATNPQEIVDHVVKTCEWAQKALAQYFEIDNIKDFEVKKKLTSAFRRVAPEGLATGIGMTFNIRSLRWIIEQRTAPWAEEEIRIVFGDVARDAMSRWPMLFQDVEKIDTGDGLFWYKPKYSKI
jgi:thymidylate synthase (FAD)